jgi:lysozyme
MAEPGWMFDASGASQPDEPTEVDTPLADAVWRAIVSRRPEPEAPPVPLPVLAASRSVNLDTPGALGIDTASWQGQPDWRKVAASGRSFAYIKASEGASTSYATLDLQYQGARAADLAVGLYHYAKPNPSAEANADALATQINRLGAVGGHLPPALDLEEGSGDLAGWAQAFIARLRARTGCSRVVVYSSSSFFQTRIGETWMDPDIALWIGHFGRPPGQQTYRSERVALHQYSESGRVAGVVGDVDLNYAIWPLARLLGEDNDLDAEQAQMLKDIHRALPIITALYQQLSGSEVYGEWPGWETWSGGTGEHLSLLDYSRRSNVETRQVFLAVQQVIAKLDGLSPVPVGAGPGSLPEADVTRIAAAVIELTSAKLAQS